jgi:non-homologous end joining protein Ku
VVQFVDAAKVDPIYLETSYYMTADRHCHLVRAHS